MSQWRSRGHYLFALGLLVALPRQCAHVPGGGSGSGGTGNVAGQSASGSAGEGGGADDAGQSGAAGLGSSAGGEAGLGGQAGFGGAAGGQAGQGGLGGVPELPDRITEPLLGCKTNSGGKATPGTFEVVSTPPTDTGNDPVRWVTDWSRDGRSAVGYFTTQSDGEAHGAITLQWKAGDHYSVEAKVRLEEAEFQEQPIALSSCDGSVIAMRVGDGSVYVQGGEMPPVAQTDGLFHDYLRLSEDGSSITLLIGSSDIRPWTEWHSTKGPISSVLVDAVHSISADGLTVFGISSCYYLSCSPPAIFRWQPLLSANPDVHVGTPSAVVAADGESVVYDFDTNFIGIWRAEGTEAIACGKPCSAVAWSSRAQVLLVNTDDGYLLWTKVHGFRTLESLLTVPPGWHLFPSDLALDGWTVMGTATTDNVTFPYFRATLNADAFN